MIMVIIYIFVAFLLIFLIYNSKLNEKIIEGNDGTDETQDCLGVYDIKGYGECDKPCGGGVQEIYFNITQPPLDGYFQGNNEEAIQCPEPKERPCNTHNCPIHCKYVGGGEGWGAWIKDRDRNGKQIGTETRTRKILVNEKYDGTPCGKVTDSREHDVDCEYVGGGDGWGAWIKDRDINGKQIGTETRTREILVNEINNGTPCGKVTETRKHDVDCVQSTWSNWGACSNTCGGGTKTRTRSILQEKKNGGNPCKLIETTSCNPDPCPINCVLGSWSNEGGCSKTCGSGVMQQTNAIITNPAHGGTICGPRQRTVSCNTQPCVLESGNYRIKTTYHAAGNQPGGWGLSAWRAWPQAKRARRNGSSSWVAVHKGSFWPMIWSVTKNTDGTYDIKTTTLSSSSTAAQQPGGWGLSAWHGQSDARRNGSSSWVAVHNGNYWPMKWNIVPGEKQNTWRILTTYHAPGNQPGGWGLSAWHGADGLRNGSSSWVAVHNGNYWPMDWVFEKA